MKIKKLFLALIVLTLAACSPARGESSPGPGKPAGEARPLPLASPTGSGPVGSFLIDRRSHSSQDALKNVELLLRSAELTGDSLSLRLAFVNTSEQTFFLTGGMTARQASLVDAAGNEYRPVQVDKNLRTGIDPWGGFSAGAANVGNLTFNRPTGGEPYVLRLPTYEPISFRLQTPLVKTSLALAPGVYPVNAAVSSSQAGLAKIELRVKSLQLEEESLTFEVSFANIGRQAYDLLVGPRGSDARLLDAEGTAYKPAQVSPGLEQSIAPRGGWAPGQEHTGALTFPRPAALEELRLTFPGYNALTLRLDQAGLAAVRLTSASGGAPQPTATPSAEEVTITGLEALLARQAQALLAGDETAYLATFAPALHAGQRQIMARLAKIPLQEVSLHIAPEVTLSQPDLAAGRLPDVAVEISYRLAGINPANIFRHNLNYSFERSGDDWQVTAVEPGERPPFWQIGDLTLDQTEHFWLFARPELADELTSLGQKTEAAYQALAASGLALEPRYVTYFTASQAEFAELSGQSSTQALGVTLSHYTFEDDQIVVSNYAFYINGELFRAQSRSALDDLQTTLTHELVHLVLAPVTRPVTPPWLTEGAAVYFSAGEMTSQQRRQMLANADLKEISLENLTQAGSLGEQDFWGQRTRDEYLFSAETFAYLVETYGQEKTLDFYRSYTRVPAADVRERLAWFGGSGGAVAYRTVFAGLRERLTIEAVQDFFGLSLAELEAQVKARITE